MLLLLGLTCVYICDQVLLRMCVFCFVTFVEPLQCINLLLFFFLSLNLMEFLKPLYKDLVILHSLFYLQSWTWSVREQGWK